MLKHLHLKNLLKIDNMIFLDLGFQPFANEYLKHKKKRKKNTDYLLTMTKRIKLYPSKKNF